MAKDDKGLTPMMKQFFSLKAKHPEALMLFRCGDFYETYCEDAVTASRILGITLTRRNNGGQSGSMEMAGFPHHALDTYLPKLIRAGKRVAICDQLEDPKKKREQLKGKKGLSEMDKMVKRGITELVTPGVAMGDNVLNYRENNFLAAVHFGKTSCGVSFLDISTGEFLTGEGNYDYVEKLLGNFQPKEVLYDRARKTDFETRFGNRYCVFELDDWVFTEQTARQKLLGHFATKSLKGFGVDHLHNGVIAAGAIMQYLEITQHTHIGHITSLARLEEEKYVRLDGFTIRSLELLQPMQEDGRSLLDVIDRTVTPMGSRMLRRWLVFPLRNIDPIRKRLDNLERGDARLLNLALLNLHEILLAVVRYVAQVVELGTVARGYHVALGHELWRVGLQLLLYALSESLTQVYLLAHVLQRLVLGVLASRLDLHESL